MTETHWNTLNGWAMNSGLDVVATLAPQQHSEASGIATRDAVWDSRNILDLISFSDHMGFNVSWQLGYECQTRCDISGGDLGKDVMRLRSMLEAFPRFARGIIAGPDVVTFKTKLQQLYLQEYLNTGAGGLSAITWHPDFASITLNPKGVSIHHDNLVLDKDALYRIIGRHMAKKPLWLAESKPEECKKQFLGALVWTRRLGNSAKLGAQVLMRQPQESNLFEPTPDYWVSVLHKTLVGRKVLDTKIATGNRSHIHFYCQCTRPSSQYEMGSLTVFGINLTPDKLVVSLKGFKIKTLHKYILLPGFDAENRMFSETVLLNNQPLKLENGKDMPEINPAVATSGKGLSMKLPSGGIGFWVIPDLKVKFCGGQENDNGDKMLSKKLSKRLEDFDSEENSANEELYGQEIDDNSDERRSFIKVSRKRRRRTRYSGEDDEVTRHKKLDARRDLARLEKLLKWRENLEERRVSALRGKPAHLGFEDKSYEMNSDNESEEMIRAKLQLYKRRLDEYEARKRHFMRSRDKQTFAESDALDNEKIEEAMRLITRVENAVKYFAQENQDSLNEGNDVAAGINGTNAEEQFLDELLKTRKMKRASIPAKIKEQLTKIYEILAAEKERRARRHEEKVVDEVKDELLSRSRRDVNKIFGDDQLGLRNDPFFTRRRNRNEDLPIKGFPKGAVYVTTGESKQKHDSRQRKPNNQLKKVWVKDENTGIPNIPKEFPVNAPKINPYRKTYGNLWEAEALVGTAQTQRERVCNHANGKILQEKPLTESQSKRAKDAVVRRLIGYYENLPSNQSDEDDTAFGPRNPETEPLIKSPRSRSKISTRHRRDADVDPLDSVLNEEMIFQDENNLKDCHCRVIRGLKDRNCQLRSKLMEKKERVMEKREQIQAKRLVLKNKLMRVVGRTRRDVISEEVHDYADEADEEHQDIDVSGYETLDESGKHEFIRLGRDTAPESLVSPTATIPSPNQPIETHQFFQSPQSIYTSSQTHQTISHPTPDNVQVDDQISPEKTEGNPTGKIPSQLTETTRDKVFTADQAATTESIAHRPEENKNVEKIASEETPRLTITPEILGNTQSMKKAPRSPRRTAPKIKTLAQTADLARLREARLIARSQASLTRKQNNGRQIPKTPPSPVQALAAETSKVQELHRRRLRELEQWREKLRIKRNKLQESLFFEELRKSSDDKAKIVKRRAIMQLLQEEKELQSVVDKGKWDYVMLYKPINYASPAKMNSGEDILESKYIPEDIEVVRPLHDSRATKSHYIAAHNYQRGPSILTFPESVEHTERLVYPQSTEYETSEESDSDEFPESLEDTENLQYSPMVRETTRETSYNEPENSSNDDMNEQEIENSQYAQQPKFADRITKKEITKSEEENSPFICMKADMSADSPLGSNTPFIIVAEDDPHIDIPLEESKEAIPDSMMETSFESSTYTRLAANETTSEGQKPSNSQDQSSETLNVDEVLDPSKDELPVLAPLNDQEQLREKRSLSKAIKRQVPDNDIWANGIHPREMKNKKLGDDSQDVYAIDDIIRIQPAPVQSETVIEEHPLASLVEEAIPKIGEAVTNGLGKAQYVTGSIEKLINELEESRNEAENIDDKTQFEMDVKNNPDGLLTHDFFFDTIRNFKSFFNFLGGISHVLIGQ